MSSENHNADKQTPPPDWKMEFDKQWKIISAKTLDFYNEHKDLFSFYKVTGFLGGLLILAWLASGIYIIDQGNRGVVTRFGAYTDTTMPGPHWHLPNPIEAVNVVNVEQQRFIEVGYSDSSRLSKSSMIPQESLMLTADENIIAVRLAVQYQINNARDYSFNVKNNERTLKQLTESVLRGVIGRNSMDFVLTEVVAKSSQKSKNRFNKRWTNTGRVSVSRVSTCKTPNPQKKYRAPSKMRFEPEKTNSV